MVLTQDAEVFYASETINDFLGVSQVSVIMTSQFVILVLRGLASRLKRLFSRYFPIHLLVLQFISIPAVNHNCVYGLILSTNYYVYFKASVIHQDFMRFVHVEDQQLLENNLKLVVTPPEQVCFTDISGASKGLV